MTHSEAKNLLDTVRPNGPELNDPRVQEALALVRSDAELAAWWDREQRLVAEITAKLRNVEPPAGLRETIIARGRASTLPPKRPSRPLPAFLFALAAGFLLLLSLLGWWRFAPIRGATLEEYAVNFVDRGFLLQTRSADLSGLRAWIAARDVPQPGELPAGFHQLRALGCRTLRFEEQEVTLVCFEHHGREYHVFVARRDPARAVGPQRTPLRELQGHVVTSWSDEANDYVLVSDASLDDVRHLL